MTAYPGSKCRSSRPLSEAHSTSSTDEGLQTAAVPPVVWTPTLSLREINNFKGRTAVIRVT